MRTCDVNGCSEKHKAAGYCRKHYERFVKHGNPTGGGTFEGEPANLLLENLKYQGTECLIWPYAKNNKGYGRIWKDGRIELVHVVVATLTYGEKPTQKHEVRHICGNGHLGCYTHSHVCWGTSKENQADRLLHGTHNRGERCGTSKLREEDVLNIRKDTRLQRKIAAAYGVSIQCISFIKTGRTWAWLSETTEG